MLVYLLVFSVLLEGAGDRRRPLLALPALRPAAVGVLRDARCSRPSRSLLENASLIRKVRFPRQLVPLSIVATQLVAFAVMLAIVIVLSLIVLPDARATAWLAIPLAARHRPASSPGSRSPSHR